MNSSVSYKRHVVVIGGGLTGLVIAHSLARTGSHVTLLESSDVLGGLARSLSVEGQTIENFYHFICRSDDHLVKLIDELGLGDRLHWRHTRTSFYYNGHLYSFGTPIDLLRFDAVPFIQRLRFGLHILRSRYRRNWRWLDEFPARAWLIENMGEEAYNVIWHPLLRVKFGEYYDRISAAWMWHRIWRVAHSRRHLWGREEFGYLEQGTATLIDPLAKWLRAQPNVTLKTQANVRSIEVVGEAVCGVTVDDGRLSCEGVVSTVALPTLARLVPHRAVDYFQKVRQVRYIGVVCALFSLKHSFSSNFWLNINDPRINFNGLIEQTNLNQHLRAAGLNMLYVPFYLPVFEPRYSLNDDQLCAEYIGMLKLINPAFDESWINERWVSRDPYAQAVCTTRFADLIPSHRAPVRGLYVTDSTQFYPEDRTLSAAVQQGRHVAQLMREDLQL